MRVKTEIERHGRWSPFDAEKPFTWNSAVHLLKGSLSRPFTMADAPDNRRSRWPMFVLFLVQIGQQLGPYEITSLIGKGGMAEERSRNWLSDLMVQH